MAIPAEWIETHDKFQQALQGVARLDAESKQLTYPPYVGETLRRSNDERWGMDHDVFILGRQDNDNVHDLLSGFSSTYPWLPVRMVHSAAFWGQMDLLESSHSLSQRQEKKHHLNPVGALEWLLDPGQLRELSVDVHPAVIRKLGDWGGRVEISVNLLSALSRDSRFSREAVAELLRYCANDTLLKTMNEACAAGNWDVVRFMQDTALGAIRVDDQTLIQTKYLPGLAGIGTLKTVFDFRARRVSEIYELPGHQLPSAFNSVSFLDYDSEALEKVRAALQNLGGRPDPLPFSLGKSRIKPGGAL